MKHETKIAHLLIYAAAYLVRLHAGSSRQWCNENAAEAVEDIGEKMKALGLDEEGVKQ